MRAQRRTDLPRRRPRSDDDWLRRIAARATPLWDRRPPATIRVAAVGAATARRRTRRWQDVLGGASILRSRLRGSGVPSPTLQCLLTGFHRRAELPSWALTLADAMRRQQRAVSERRGGESGRDRSYDRRAPLPFQEILAGLVAYAREEVAARAGSSLGILRVPARAALERQLLAHLTFIGSLTLGRDYYEYRFARAPASVFESLWRARAPSTDIYRAYVRHMRHGGLAGLLDSYPVLARLLSQSVEQWIDAVTEFCSRFVEDFSELRSCFAWKVDEPVRAVAQVTAGLSDRHRGGRTVLACRLGTGEEVVYKPRSVQPEKAFYGFVDWLNDQELALKLKSLRVLDRVTHGWVEAVRFAPCRARAEVERFYRRAGMLLGVLYALATTDVHRENLIASGDHPVVVDLETIVNDGVRVRPEDDESAGPSVMSTGMLPFWTTPGEDDCDMSALGSDDTQDPGIRSFVWDAVNTDQMRMLEEPAAATGMTHRVRLHRRRPSAREHLASLLDGFREVYACLLENRERLIRDRRSLSAFDNLTLRILVRDTVTYTRLQLYSLHPEFLRDGLDRSIELEWLARPLCPRPDQEGPRRVYRCERTAMEQLDVPHFTTDDWKATPHAFDDEEMRRLFEERGSRVVIERLRALSAADCDKQLAIIEKAIRRRFAP